MSRSLANPSFGARTPSPSVPPTLRGLAHPNQKQVDAVVYDVLLIEMVRTLRGSASVARKRERELEEEMVENGLIEKKAVPASAPATTRDSVSSVPASKGAVDEDEEAVRARLEAVGVHVGMNIVERLARDRPRFTDTLDTVKFICKDVWTAVWEKQVENLRTNHRGVYVLTDTPFKPLARISAYGNAPEVLQKAKIYAHVPAGIIRGSLARLGLHGTVSPDVSDLPRCTFQIKLAKTS
ncbi:Transport protein particle (TRAPP) component [Ceratobasidium sp. AG-Ba]|nr:Transport protein particle (TRAPP) component [Ceratobasidium sp. AG-Ba]QRV91753.1 Transport protein particle (TRAPP) component [Ceratobasidium sp. AG-Ba]